MRWLSCWESFPGLTAGGGIVLVKFMNFLDRYTPIMVLKTGLSLTIIAVAWATLLGYAENLPWLYCWTKAPYIPMAFNSALLFLFVGFHTLISTLQHWHMAQKKD